MDDLDEALPSPALRVLIILTRIWQRLTSVSTLRLLSPVFAALLLLVLWWLWKRAAATPLTRALRWWIASSLVAALCACALFLMMVPPEDAADANVARVAAEERAIRATVYTVQIAVLGGSAVFLATLAAAGALRRSRTSFSERREAVLAWDRVCRPFVRPIGVLLTALVVIPGAVAVGAVVTGTSAAAEIPSAVPGTRSRATLWVGTNAGLSRLVEDSGGPRWEPYRRPWSPLPSNDVTSVAAGPDGEVWLSTTAGLARVAVGSDGKAVWKDATAASGALPGVIALDVAVDSSGIAWAATEGGGAAVDKEGQSRVFTYRSTPLLHQLLDAAYVDREGRVWLGGAGGVNVYRPPTRGALENTGEWIAGFNRSSTEGALPENLVFNISGDTQGRIWFGTVAGAAVLTPNTNAYSLGTGDRAQWQTFTPTNSPLPSPKVHTIVQDRAGRIYLGTEEGIAILDESAPPERRWRVLRGEATVTAGSTGTPVPTSVPSPPAASAASDEIRLPDPWVEAMAVGPDGRVWIGTKRGLAIYDPTRGLQVLPVYRSNPIRRWTALFWPPHSHLDVVADQINALAWSTN